MNNYKEIFKSCVVGLIKYLKESGLRSMVLGISGGIDSSVCAVICHEVTRREPTLEFYGVSLPCSTNSEDENSVASKIGKAFIPDFFVHNLQKDYENIEASFSEQVSSTPLSQGNIKARLRMIYLRNLAGLKDGLVVDTDNMSENMLGFFTIAGDQGDVSPIAQLWKHEVYDLAEWMISEYAKTEEQKEALKLSAGLIPTDGNGVKAGGDLAQIAPSLESYDELDEILMCYKRYREKPTEANLFFLNKVTDKYGEDTISEIIKRHKQSEYKRKKLPVVLELSGIDREEPSKEELMKRVEN